MMKSQQILIILFLPYWISFRQGKSLNCAAKKLQKSLAESLSGLAEVSGCGTDENLHEYPPYYVPAECI